MEEKKPGRIGLFTGALIMLLVVMGIFMLAESAFIVSNSGILSGLLSDFKHTDSDKVAVIYVEGELVTDNVPEGSGYASSDSIVKELRDEEADGNVKAIVLRINSPGGTPVAAEEIYSQVNRTRQIKPVVVSMGDMATSAAYYISSPSTKIVANPDTFTGSIGVIWTFENKSGQYEQEGVEHYVAKSGSYKDVGADWRGLNDSEKEYVNEIVNEAYGRFVDAVAAGRHMDRAKVQQLADGRVYTGKEAMDLGLVDQTGGMYDAIDLAARLGGISGEPEIVFVNQQSLYGILLSGKTDGNTTTMQLPAAGTADNYQPYSSPYGRIYA